MFVLCISWMMIQAPQAKADYILRSGDALELTVFGRADLNRRAVIDIDGNVTFPLIGELKVSGLSLAALRKMMRGQLEASDAVRGSDVILELVETRPFYIHGDVARSGAYPFYKGLTVRHAIAVAGGLDSARGKANTTPREISELRGKYNQARSELLKLQIRVASLQAEISNSSDIDPSVKTQALKGQSQELVETELQNLKTRVAERRKEQEYLKISLKLADEEVSALERSQQQDEEARKQQVAEMQRVAELSSKGLASSGRVTEEQRATVLLKSREMDTAARLALARRQREEVLWNMAKADERRFVALEELKTAVASLADMRIQVASLGEQLALAGDQNAQSSDEEESVLDIRIYRAGESKEGASADEDAELSPGDVVEIRQRLTRGNKGL
jgi:polysaccharide export outer membrane protein